MDVEFVSISQVCELGKSLLRQPVSMDIPVRADMAQEPAFLARPQPLPYRRSNVSDERDGLAPVSATALGFLRQFPDRAKQCERGERCRAQQGGAVAFAGCVLKHRFRYDIEIDEVQTIRAGEFDITIE